MTRLLFAQLGRIFAKTASGGALYVVLVLAAVLFVQQMKLSQVGSKLHEITSIKNQALEQVREKDGVISAQSRQFQRRIQSQESQDNADTLIEAVPDSHYCYESLPVNGALEWLRQRESPNPKVNDD